MCLPGKAHNHSSFPLHGWSKLCFCRSHGSNYILRHFPFRNIKVSEIFRQFFISLQCFREVRITIGTEKGIPVSCNPCKSSIGTAKNSDPLPQVFIAEDGFHNPESSGKFESMLHKVTTLCHILHFARGKESFINSGFRENK